MVASISCPLKRRAIPESARRRASNRTSPEKPGKRSAPFPARGSNHLTTPRTASWGAGASAGDCAAAGAAGAVMMSARRTSLGAGGGAAAGVTSSAAAISWGWRRLRRGVTVVCGSSASATGSAAAATGSRSRDKALWTLWMTPATSSWGVWRWARSLATRRAATVRSDVDIDTRFRKGADGAGNAAVRTGRSTTTRVNTPWAAYRHKKRNTHLRHNGIAEWLQASAIESAAVGPSLLWQRLDVTCIFPAGAMHRSASLRQAQCLDGSAARGTLGEKPCSPLHARRGWRADKRRSRMLYWAVVFLVIAIIAGILGFGGIASTAAGIAQVLFFIFLVIFVIALIMGLVRRRPPPV